MNEVDKPQPETNSSENSSPLSRELEEIASAANSRPEKDPKPEENIDTDRGKSEKLTESLNLPDWTRHVAINLDATLKEKETALKEKNQIDGEKGQIDGEVFENLVIRNMHNIPKEDQRIALVSALSAFISHPNTEQGLRGYLLSQLDKVSKGDDISHLTNKQL